MLIPFDTAPPTKFAPSIDLNKPSLCLVALLKALPPLSVLFNLLNPDCPFDNPALKRFNAPLKASLILIVALTVDIYFLLS